MSEDKRLVAVVVEGKFREPPMLKVLIEKANRTIARLSKKYIENRGGVFLVYPDETFMDISYWDTPENAERIVEGELLKTIGDVYNDEMLEKFSVRYYRIKLESRKP